MSEIIKKIINQEISKSVGTKHYDSDLEFYRNCELEFIDLENRGYDFSECKNFEDLCKIKHKSFLQEIE